MRRVGLTTAHRAVETSNAPVPAFSGMPNKATWKMGYMPNLTKRIHVDRASSGAKPC